jgi:hypothetical protein
MYDATSDSIAFASCSGVLGLLMSLASHAKRSAFNTPAERIPRTAVTASCGVMRAWDSVMRRKAIASAVDASRSVAAGTSCLRNDRATLMVLLAQRRRLLLSKQPWLRLFGRLVREAQRRSEPIERANQRGHSRGHGNFRVWTRRTSRRISLRSSCSFLERAKGFEPSTCSMGSCHSTTELSPREAREDRASGRGSQGWLRLPSGEEELLELVEVALREAARPDA